MKEQRINKSAEFRLEERDGKHYLRGYGIVFNSESHPIYGMFIERIEPRALDGADMGEIISKYNHDMNRTLGTTWANTLKYGTDERGVWYEVELPKTATGEEVRVLAERGDLRGSSFEFDLNPEGATWSVEKRDGKNMEIRTITSIKGVYDLSPVMRPAYPATEGTIEVYKRQMQEAGITEQLIDRDTLKLLI